MPWFKVDDGFHSHPKAIQAGTAACGLWARCGSWSSGHLTDGFVPSEVALMYGTKTMVRALVAAGLWVQVEGGYHFHEWDDRNPTRIEVEALREVKRAAGRVGGKASGRTRAEAKQPASTLLDPSLPSGSEVLNTRPEPLPIPKEQPPQPTVGAPQARRGTRFPEQWFLNADLRAWATEKCPAADVTIETEQWADHHRAKGDTAKDWTASWRTWMRNAQKWAPQRRRQQPPTDGLSENSRAHLALVEKYQAQQQGEIA